MKDSDSQRQTRTGPRTPRISLAVALALAATAPLTLTGCATSGEEISRIEQIAQQRERARELAQRGVRAHSRGDVDAALDLYYQSVALDSDLPIVRNNLGLILLAEQNYMDAVFQFRTAMDLAPSDPRPPTNIGVAYSEAGYPQDALRNFDIALRVDETYLPALRGAIQAASDVSRASPEDLRRIKTALLRERDPEWRDFFSRERFRIENRLRLDRDRPAADDVLDQMDSFGAEFDEDAASRLGVAPGLTPPPPSTLPTETNPMRMPEGR